MDKDTLDTPIDTNLINEIIYPGLIERIKALITDSVVLIGLMVCIGTVFSKMDNVPEQARMIAFVFVFILYDPLMTSIFGGTIGHLIVGIRVQRDDKTNGKIMLPMAIIRYLLKALLGWISFLTIIGNDKGKAIHDLTVNSVVVFKN
jgi:uncharacterized RDD family membrane protein YckC